MGGSLPPLDLDDFVNHGRQNPNQQLGNQIRRDQEIESVHEYSHGIRNGGLNVHPAIRRISDDLLRLNDTNEDLFKCIGRLRKRAIQTKKKLDRIFIEPSNIHKIPIDPTLKAQLGKEAGTVLVEYNQKLVRPLQRIKSMYKYHIRAIQELKRRKFKGELECDIFSVTKFNFLCDKYDSLKADSKMNEYFMVAIVSFEVNRITEYVQNYRCGHSNSNSKAFDLWVCFSRSPFYTLICVIFAVFITISLSTTVFC